MSNEILNIFSAIGMGLAFLALIATDAQIKLQNDQDI